MNHYLQAKESHQHCIACGQHDHNDNALQLEFIAVKAGEVSAHFTTPNKVQGYNGLQHGGITSTLLDAAMTHALFSLGICALTAELNVRFVKPISLGSQLVISARCLRQKRSIYLLEAEIKQGLLLMAKANGKFIKNESITNAA